MKAFWNRTLIADSDDTIVVEGNHYFPANTIRNEYFTASDTHTICPWKGTAHYYSLEIDGKVNKDAAWYYPETKEAARNIQGYIAFWNGVMVTE